MSPLPPPSRRVLADLGGTYSALRPTISTAASSVQRSLAELLSLLDAQASAFAVRDRAEAAFVQRHRFVRSGELAEFEAQEHRLATRIDAAAVSLLLAPSSGSADLTIKVGVLIALSEAGPTDSGGFPGAYLRALLADIDRMCLNP